AWLVRIKFSGKVLMYPQLRFPKINSQLHLPEFHGWTGIWGRQSHQFQLDAFGGDTIFQANSVADR
ncbi:MAG: hypothetical protein AAAC48_13865, partial [Phyllobacterium sp.]|uniref:hypothetical protein n=1 Tax=Phyllobacterium sp. TaxID=1871046 RepID=UPI0030F03BCE